MPDSYFYTVHASSETLQSGKIKAGDVMPPEIRFSAPPEFGGIAGAWTPEYFLLSALASCFIATFEAIARASDFQFSSISVIAEGIVEKAEGKWKFGSITLNPTVVVESEEDRDRALKLLGKTERSCIVANSLSTKLQFVSQITIFEDSVMLAD